LQNTDACQADPRFLFLIFFGERNCHRATAGHAAIREFCFVVTFRAGVCAWLSIRWSWPNIGSSGSGAARCVRGSACCNQCDCDAITPR